MQLVFKVGMAIAVFAMVAFTKAHRVSQYHTSNGEMAHPLFFPVTDSVISEEYFSDGKLKSRCVDGQTDTISQIDPITGEEMMIITQSIWTTCTTYYHNGKQALSSFFDKGKKEGDWIYNDTIGNLLKKEFYENDNLIRTEYREKIFSK